MDTTWWASWKVRHSVTLVCRPGWILDKKCSGQERKCTCRIGSLLPYGQPDFCGDSCLFNSLLSPFRLCFNRQPGKEERKREKHFFVGMRTLTWKGEVKASKSQSSTPAERDLVLMRNSFEAGTPETLNPSRASDCCKIPFLSVFLCQFFARRAC